MIKKGFFHTTLGTFWVEFDDADWTVGEVPWDYRSARGEGQFEAYKKIELPVNKISSDISLYNTYDFREVYVVKQENKGRFFVVLQLQDPYYGSPEFLLEMED
jgi:hypothetical protein